jgi:hypothetical protein
MEAAGGGEWARMTLLAWGKERTHGEIQLKCLPVH